MTRKHQPLPLKPDLQPRAVLQHLKVAPCHGPKVRLWPRTPTSVSQSPIQYPALPRLRWRADFGGRFGSLTLAQSWFQPLLLSTEKEYTRSIHSYVYCIYCNGEIDETRRATC